MWDVYENTHSQNGQGIQKRPAAFEAHGRPRLGVHTPVLQGPREPAELT